MTACHDAPARHTPAPSHTTRFDIDLAQRWMARTVVPPLAVEEVPIGKAVGRVLAELPMPRPGHALPPPVEGCTIEPGVRLQEKHIPWLAASGRPSIRVYARVKIGILTLAGPPPNATRDEPDATLAGPMLAALLDGLGAHAIAAPPVHGDHAALCAVLDKLLGECAIVLIAGQLSAPRHDQIEALLRARGAALADWRLCEELGTRLSMASLQAQVVLCLPTGLGEAFMAFMLLVSPLVRRRQGRSAVLPRSRAARVRHGTASTAGQGKYMWARETDSRSEITVHAPVGADPIDAIAASDGVARTITVGSAGDAIDVEYYPYAAWLQ